MHVAPALAQSGTYAVVLKEVVFYCQQMGHPFGIQFNKHSVQVLRNLGWSSVDHKKSWEGVSYLSSH